MHAKFVIDTFAAANNSVDCIITDMPYGVGVDFGDYRDNVENLQALIDAALPEMRRVGTLCQFADFTAATYECI